MIYRAFSALFSLILINPSLNALSQKSTENRETRRIILLLDYISTDYKEAIDPKGTLSKNNKVINLDEYEEMQDFALSALKLYKKLPESFHDSSTENELLVLLQKINEKAPSLNITELTQSAKKNILSKTSFSKFPKCGHGGG